MIILILNFNLILNVFGCRGLIVVFKFLCLVIVIVKGCCFVVVNVLRVIILWLFCIIKLDVLFLMDVICRVLFGEI